MNTSNLAKKVADQLIATGTATHAYLGVSIGNGGGTADGPRPASLVLDSYLLRALALGGWAPSCYDCARCGAPGPHAAFHVQAGGAVCSACRPAGAVDVDPGTMALLGALLSGDWDVADASTGRERAQASGIVSAYVTWHLERRLRSLSLVERV